MTLMMIALFFVMTSLSVLPSANVTLVIVRSATLGTANGLAVSAGIVLGDLVFVALAILGLSVIAEKLGWLFIFIKLLGGFYLIWLGISLLMTNNITTNNMVQYDGKGRLFASFLAGFFVTLGDIKAIIFYASLFPFFIDLSVISRSEIIEIVVITILSVGGIKAIYAILATKLVAYTNNKKVEEIVIKMSGIIMTGVGFYLLFK